MEIGKSVNSQWGSSEQGAAAGVVIGVVALCVVAVSVLFYLFGTVVPPNYIGVRQNFWSIAGILDEGYSTNGLSPGLHFQFPGLSRIILLPRDFQYIDFNADEEPSINRRPELEIPTTDGPKVKTDVSIVFRLYESAVEGGAQPHGGPHALIEAFTTDPSEHVRRLATKGENELKQSLSGLSTTDFYNPTLRENAANKASTALAEKANPIGIQIWGTLIRRYWYSEQKIDDQIFAKNLQDQTERLFAAKNILAGAKAETEQQRALWDAKVRSLEVSGESKVSVLRSEGSLYEAKKRADGDLAVANAKADVDKAKAGALSDVAGAEVYVAREMAPIFQALQGGVVSGLDPFDVNKWVEKLLPAEPRGEGRK